MSFRRRRGSHAPHEDDVCLENADPDLFFGAVAERKNCHKVEQLCRQVERAAGVALAEISDGGAEVLSGSVVAGAHSAPDASRIAVVVVLSPERGVDCLDVAHRLLGEHAGRVRAEVARTIRRKRTPEIAFQVFLTERVDR